MKPDSTHKRILNALLDKLERSKQSMGDSEPTRRIMLSFYSGGKSDFPYYDIEQSERRISINRAIDDLEKQGLVSYNWMKGEHGHIVEKVWLNVGNAALAYRLTSRQPKNDLVAEVKEEIQSAMKKVRSDWALAFLMDAHDEITRKQRLTSIMPSEKEERTLLLAAILAASNPDGSELMERVFSLSVFGDSKTFERTVRTKLLRILRRYMENDDDATEEDILKQVGIVKYPEPFEFCGGLTIEFGDGNKSMIDFSALPSGGVIYSSDFANGKLSVVPSVETVISIENRANYIEYIRTEKTDSELVINHGGQFSPRKGEFLRVVAKKMPNGCKWRHWGDIDYGGFLMLLRLRQHVHPEILTHRMSTSEMVRFADFAVPIKAKYAERLERLKSFPELSDAYECIDYMTKYMLRLEQEAMLTDT